MSYDFLFWLFLIGLIIASFQDIKRREVDDWLNLLLIISGFSFIMFKFLLERETTLVFISIFIMLFFLVLMNLFYSGRVFAGGDAKLLLAISIFFVTPNFLESITNSGIFVFFLMVSGSIYGLIYSFILYFKNFSKANKEISKEFLKLNGKILIFWGILILFLGFFSWIFLFLGTIILFFPFLYSFARGLENVSMIKTVSGRDLREGDWLAEDVNMGRKKILSNWEGVSLEEIRLMKNLKKIKIKEGLPFVPAFLIAFIIYIFFKFPFISFI